MAILNRRLTRAELVAEIEREGLVRVGGFNYAARDALAKQFQAFIQDEFQVAIQVQYITDAAPETFLQNVLAARQSNAPAPYDVVAVDEMYFFDAQKNDAAAELLPSDLLHNVTRIESAPLHEPYAVPFQAASTIAPIFHKDAVGAWLHDWNDLADARLRRRITLPKAEGIVAGAFLIGVAGSLNKDYKNPAQMRETIEFVCTEMQPNVWKYTNDFGEMQTLLREDRIDAAVGWNLLARLERYSRADGTQDISFRAMRSGQPALNGYAWIPKNAPHPVLAQLFINWRLGDDGQFPNAQWNISETAWGEYHEGLLGESSQDAIPEKLRASYFEMYPSVEELQNLYTPIDWTYYAEHEAEWMSEYKKCAR